MTELEKSEHAAQQAPTDTALWLSLAQASTQALDWARAERAYAHLHTLAPQHGGIARNWLRALGEQGKTIEAIAIAARWLRAAPDDIAMWKRVSTLAHEGRHWESEICAQRNLMRLEPDAPEHPYRMACAVLEMDRFEEARLLRAAARKRWPEELRLLWLDVATHRTIADNNAQIDADRAETQAALVEAEHWHGDATFAFDALGRSHFYSAYHGKNECQRAQRVAAQIERIAHLHLPASAFAAKKTRPSPGQKIKVAMVSLYWYRHTISHYFGGWVKHLDRTRFEIALAGDGATRDAITAELEACVDAVLRPRAEQSLMRSIEAWQPDVVFFLDVGMVGKHMPMFAYRLAPLQLAAWGHPVTTGFSQIDGYITVAAMEPPNWREHYSEKQVIALPGQGIYYTPPKLPAPSARAAFGLPEEATLLCCAQSLFKIHPDDEALFCDVLQALPQAHLILFSLADANATTRFRARFERALTRTGLTAARVTFLPQMAHENFLQVLALSAAVLDTHHFSGGKTSMDALACGTPIVTWPGEFMRGRQTTGMLTLIGEMQLIAGSAADFVAIVSHVAATTPTQSRQERQQRARVLWNDLAPVRALEREIEHALFEQTNSTDLRS